MSCIERSYLGFNTTFVTVLLISGMFQQLQCHCFNTTFVTVLCHFRLLCGRWQPCFNTTFVTVLYCWHRDIIPPWSVSIQLLLLFYWTMWPGIKSIKRRFNTTFVTVLLSWGKQSTYHHLVSIQLLLLFY